jgi:hypothetical protein
VKRNKRTRCIGLPATGAGSILLLAALLGWPAHAHEANEAGKEKIETEHIFGFTEGTDIGDKGEQEFESTTVGYFGKTGGYTVIGNESAYRNVLFDGFRLSFEAFPDYHRIHGMPGLADRNNVNFSGVASELRWQLSDRSKIPIGISISLAPEFRWVDDLSGTSVQGYSLPMVAAFDTALVPDKLYAAINLGYDPAITRAGGRWESGTGLEASGAASYAVTRDIFIGAELRYIAWDDQNSTRSRGLFAGPSFYVNLSKTSAFKVAWSREIAEETPRAPGLANFERDQVIVLFMKSF